MRLVQFKGAIKVNPVMPISSLKLSTNGVSRWATLTASLRGHSRHTKGI